MLALLLDENLSPAVARELSRKRHEIPVISIHDWHSGKYVAASDEVILIAAAAEARTLVTYDQKTIMPLLARYGHAGTAHAGVVFIDERTIAPNDFGTLIRALAELWESARVEDWTDRVQFLRSSR